MDGNHQLLQSASTSTLPVNTTSASTTTTASTTAGGGQLSSVKAKSAATVASVPVVTSGGPTHLQIKQMTLNQSTLVTATTTGSNKKINNTTVPGSGGGGGGDLRNSATLPSNLANSVSVDPQQHPRGVSTTLLEKKTSLLVISSSGESADFKKPTTAAVQSSGSELKTMQKKPTTNDSSGNSDDDEANSAVSPFKRNNNSGILNSDNSEFSNLNETDAKLVKKSKGKTLLKRLFCCFSTGGAKQHNYKTSDPTATAVISKNGTTSSHMHSAVNSGTLHADAVDNNNNTNSSNKENIIISVDKDELATMAQKLQRQEAYESYTTSGSNAAANANSTAVASTRLVNITINNGSANQQPPATSNNNYYSNDSFIPQNIPLCDIVDNFDLDYDYEEEEKHLLPPVRPSDNGKKCLIIDLDETLVHSSFKHVHNADFVVPVEIDGTVHQVYVLKRPHVDEFLRRMGELYECVLFTASLAKYADPVSDLLDKWGVFRGRLFREACVFYRGNYVKDLSRLGRDLNKVIILDNSPASYIFHPDNAVPCTSWFDDMHDTELLDLIPHFERLAAVDSVYAILRHSNSNNNSSNSMNSNFYAQHLNQQQQQQQHLHQLPQYDTSTSSSSGNQQVPQSQSIIYQVPQQQPQQPPPPPPPIQQHPQYYNENKVLVSIDLMMAKQQQQQQ